MFYIAMNDACRLLAERAVSPAAPAALPSLLPATTARALARGTLQISCVNGRSGVEHRSGQQNWHWLAESHLSHTLLPGSGGLG